MLDSTLLHVLSLVAGVYAATLIISISVTVVEAALIMLHVLFGVQS
jgi:hypothetical protein